MQEHFNTLELNQDNSLWPEELKLTSSLAHPLQQVPVITIPPPPVSKDLDKTFMSTHSPTRPHPLS